MCVYRPREPKPMAMPTPAPIIARNPGITQQSELPTKKELVDEDEVSGVAYGGSQKQEKTAGKKVGTKSLRIPLNTASTSSTAGQGGVNV
tara:strand:+ start:220 stop:489 length:270 start_codon:yes stop_codon:yes gene_type:complete